MKFVVISRLNTGTENAKKALGVFMKVGLEEGTEASFAGADGKTFINIVETDGTDISNASTFAPFFESIEVIPVVAMDDAWMAGIQKAVSAWD